MKLVIKSESGLVLLRPHKVCQKVIWIENKRPCHEVRLENGETREIYPQEALLKHGEYAVKRVENPCVPGGEAWIVLMGGRVGAAESWFTRLAAATRETAEAVVLVTD